MWHPVYLSQVIITGFRTGNFYVETLLYSQNYSYDPYNEYISTKYTIDNIVTTISNNIVTAINNETSRQ